MKTKTRKHWALILVCALIVGILPMGNVSFALAEASEDHGLHNPTTGADGVTTWDCVYFGSYPQSDATGKTKEPIKWRVLSVDGDDAFLLADMNLDVQKYDNTNREIMWFASTMRTWLNGTFLNKAFTESEQSAIKKTTIANNDNEYYPGKPAEGGGETEDKVFLLSLDEVKEPAYGFTSDDSTRRAQNTEYVKKQGNFAPTVRYYENGIWWLRSPGKTNDLASYVECNGKVYGDGFMVDEKSFTVRPALHLDLSSVSDWSYADTVSSDGEETATAEPATATPEVTSEPATASPEVTSEPAAPSAEPTIEPTEAASPAVVVSNPRIVKNDKMESGQEVTWDCVYFGSYPQAEVIDTELSKDYTAIGSAYLKEGDLIVNDDLYTTLLTAPSTEWDANGDIVLDGNKYRRIRKDDATSKVDGLDGYYNWSDSLTYHYFKYEPIKWRVLSSDGNTALLLSDVGLDDQQYNASNALSQPWKHCTIRCWLNGYDTSFLTSEGKRFNYISKNFINSAFTSDEQAAIISTDVVNDDNLSHGTRGGDDTTDKIFLLSESEVYGTEKAQGYGFASPSETHDEARGTRSSTYAKAMGACWSNSEEYIGNCSWTLRSPGKTDTDAVYISTHNYVVIDGFTVKDKISAVRMAMNLNLNVSSDMISYAGTVCSGGTDAETGGDPSPSPDATPSASPSPDTTPSASPSPDTTASASPSQNPSASANPSQTSTPSESPSQTSAPLESPDITGSENGSQGNQGTSSTAAPGTSNGNTQNKVTSPPSPTASPVTVSVPSVPKIKSLKAKAGKKKLTVTWKAVSGVNGYQLEISTKKNFKGAKKVTIRSSKKKYVAKKLKNKKKYYIRIRAYKTYTNAANRAQTVCGKWTTVVRKTK